MQIESVKIFKDESLLEKLGTLGRKKKTVQQMEQEAENEAIEVDYLIISNFSMLENC